MFEIEESCIPGLVPDPPFASFVLLLARPRLLAGRALRATINRTLGTSLPLDEDGPLDAPAFVIGQQPPFALWLGRQLYLLHAFPTRYWDDIEHVVAGLDDKEQRRAVRRHRAWLSVDAIFVPDRQRRASAYRTAAKLIAALADGSSLAVHAPATELLRPWTNDIGRTLAMAEDPVGALLEQQIAAWAERE